MIVLKDICKVLGNKTILNNISFHIAPDEAVGIIGLNGAGKTTLLNMIAGMLKPDSGFIRVGGTESTMDNKSVLRNIAYVSGTKSQLWQDIRIKDSFDNCAAMYQIEAENAGKRRAELEDIFEIKACMHRKPESLSLGERMRCELVYALLAEPKLLMLDEAMIGLDVSVKYSIMQYLQAYRDKKKSAIIYTSHNLVEVEKLCNRIILIDAGNIIFDGSIDRIMQEFSPLYHMEIIMAEGFPDLEDLPVEKICIAHNRLTIVYDKQKIETAQILKHVMRKSRITDVRVFEPDLEKTIQKIYERMD